MINYDRHEFMPARAPRAGPSRALAGALRFTGPCVTRMDRACVKSIVAPPALGRRHAGAAAAAAQPGEPPARHFAARMALAHGAGPLAPLPAWPGISARTPPRWDV